MKPLSLIHEFLELNRFALIGVSRNPSDFSRKLFAEFLYRGYDVVPVNPFGKEMEGFRCFADIKEVTPPVSAAMVMTGRGVTEQVLRDCADWGITLVWIFGISGEKDVSPGAMAVCRSAGINVIAGHCPYMFLPRAGLFHRIHGAAWKLAGLYPES